MSNSVTNGAITIQNNASGGYSIPVAFGSGGGGGGVSGVGGVGHGYTISYPDIAQYIGTVSVQGHLEVQSGVKGEISPKLYIKYVKSKLTQIQQKRLKIRLSKLQKLVQNANDMGQTAMYENLSSMLAVVIRESEAVACGITTYVDREYINKYSLTVKEKPVKFDLLEKFPRTIPENIRKQIKAVQARKLFDNLHVLYLDYTKQDTRSTKEKIRDKDPILFGTYSYQPDRFYYICDWVDEYCDLTMDKFVDKIKEEDPEFALTTVPEMDEQMFSMIKKEVKDRHDRLTGTKPSNFRGLMDEEDQAKAARQLTVAKKPWYKRLLGGKNAGHAQ